MSYRPGRCNIGSHQRRRRLTVATAGFGLAALVALASLGGLVPAQLLPAVFIPLAVGFEWGLQAHAGFCVRLAVLGQYDFRGEGGTEGPVSSPDARRADAVYAATITCLAVGLAVLSTVLTVSLLG